MTYQLRQPLQIVNYNISMEKDWTVGYGHKGLAFAVKRPNGGTVCNLPEGLRPEEKQLGNLIAATPDLLAALELIVGDARNNLVKEHFFIALEAIVKAKEGK